jgi:hypothetical protein
MPYYVAELVNARGEHYKREDRNLGTIRKWCESACSMHRAEAWLFEGHKADRCDKLRSKYRPGQYGVKAQHYK